MNPYPMAGALVASVCTGMAWAGAVVDLAPGQLAEGMSGITNAQMPELIGTVEFAHYNQFSVSSLARGADAPLYRASLLMSAVRSNQTGNLTLNFRIYNPDSSLEGQISHVEITGFENLQTRVEYRGEASGPGDEGPASAQRSIDGGVLTYDFGESLQTSESSRLFFAMLNVSEYDMDAYRPQATIYLLSGESVSIDIAPPVPAPGALALLGLGGLCAARRRR